MKARIVEKQPERILTFSIDEAMRTELSAVLQRLSMEEIQINTEDLGQEVGYLAGLPGFQKKEGVPEEEPLACQGVLCMCGLSNGRMDTLLKSLREARVNIPIKSVVTATNQHWSFSKLVKELAKEHETMEAMRKKKESNSV